MRTKLISILLAISCIMIFTGCWDNVELNDRHIVLDIAIDKSETDNYRVTYSIPDVAKLSGAESLAEEPKSALSVDSPTIARSINDMEDKTQNTISFSHIKAILLGKELMADKTLFKMAIDSLKENMEVGHGTYLLAVDGKAEDIAGAENYQNPILGLYAMQYFNNEERAVGDSQVQSIGRFSKEMQETGVAVIPMITADEEQSTLNIGGGAVIKDYELAGWLSKEEVRSKLLLDGEVRNVPIVVETEDNYYTYEIKDQDCRIEYNEQEQQLIIGVEITVYGELTEYASYLVDASDNEKILRQINTFIQKELTDEVTIGLKKAQEMNVDFLHLSDDLYRKHPELYKKYQPIWQNRLYDTTQIHIDVKTKIEGFGMT